MSKAASSEGTADDARQLAEIAGELYGLHPDAFAAARDEHVRTARAEGRKQLARELGGLRRPSMSAWLINLLWRDQPEVVEQFLELGGELGKAQAEASGPELHRLTALRRGLEAALIRTARALAQKAGANVSASMEREAQETLSAALARPEVADDVRTGRLVKPAAYAGFGTVVSSGSPAFGREVTADDPERARPAPARLPTSGDREARLAQRARERREEAERDLEAARAAVTDAAEVLADEARAADDAQQQHATLRQQVEALEAQLRALQDELRTRQEEAAAAQHAAVAAARRREQAEKAHETALRALQRAERELEQATP
jgi:hypothetical protein